MKMHVQVDERKMREKLRQAAKRFGDTTEQAVARLGVQVSREMAIVTQPFGGRGKKGSGNSAKEAQDKQRNAIEKGMRAVIVPLQAVRKTRNTVRGYSMEGRLFSVPKSRWLTSADQVNQWVDQRRTRRRGRTPKNVPISEVAACTMSVFKKARNERWKKAGMAKGGWLAAGKRAARYQRGGFKIAIGKNFLAWAQRAGANRGTARLNPNRSRIAPQIILSNNVRHAGDRNVFNPSLGQQQIKFAVQKLLKDYRRAAKAALDKA